MASDSRKFNGTFTNDTKIMCYEKINLVIIIYVNIQNILTSIYRAHTW